MVPRAVRFETIAEFCARVGRSLESRETENNVLIGICSRSSARASLAADDLVAVFDGDRFVVAGIRPAGGRLILADADEPEAMALLAASLAEPVVPGVVGPLPGVAMFAAVYAERTGVRPVLATAERLMALTAVTRVDGVAGGMRTATAEDRATLVAWSRAFAGETGDDIDDEEVEAIVDAALLAQPARRFLWVADGVPVSMAGIAGPTPNGIRINWVYTPREHRRRGFATALVAALSQAQLDAGRRVCFLFTDAANPTSNHIYETIGYRHMRDVALYRFEPAT